MAAELAPVEMGHDAVADAHAGEVGDERGQTLLVHVVGDEDAGVLHECGDVGGLAAGGRGHVHDELSRLRVERHDREEGRGGLAHVVAGEVLRRARDGHLVLVDLEADLGPVAERVQVDTAVQEHLGQVAAARLERVGADDQRALRLVRLKELEALAGREHRQEAADQLGQVAEVLCHVVLQQLQVVGSRALGVAEHSEVSEHEDHVAHSLHDHGQVRHAHLLAPQLVLGRELEPVRALFGELHLKRRVLGLALGTDAVSARALLQRQALLVLVEVKVLVLVPVQTVLCAQLLQLAVAELAIVASSIYLLIIVVFEH